MDTSKSAETTICQRCRRMLRVSDDIRCEPGEVKYHSSRAVEVSDGREAGDRSLQWRCAVCHTTASKQNLDKDTKHHKDYENLLHAINVISDKFELVNKIQLPKLNSDMLQIKSVTDRIMKQNEDIIRKINEFDNKRKNSEKNHCNCVTSHSSYRKRNLTFAPSKPKSNKKNKSKKEDSDQGSLMPMFDSKGARYRTKRRSCYLLNNMFLLLNGKFRKSRSQRRKF